MGDPSAVDDAVVSTLANDATLAALMPDGVWFDLAPAGLTKFVIVSLATHADDYVFGGSAFEKSTYLVKAVDQNVSGATVKTSAARIQTLLQDATLTIAGYHHLLLQRQERVRYVEVDEVNPDLRWQHRGGRYAVMVEPT